MKTLIFLFLFSISLSAQSKFELEIRGSRNTTYNQGELISSMRNNGFHLDEYEVTLFSNFRPTEHYSYSLGLLYRIKERSHIKVHIGYHQNGFIFDIDKLNGTNSGKFLDAENKYKYLQFVPSYTYLVGKGKHSIPLDIGLSINIPTNGDRPYYLGSSHVNIDLRTSVGYAYRIYDNISLGINFVASYAPFPYVINSPVGYETIEGEFQPYQFGIEATVKYDLPSK